MRLGTLYGAIAALMILAHVANPAAPALLPVGDTKIRPAFQHIYDQAPAFMRSPDLGYKQWPGNIKGYDEDTLGLYGRDHDTMELSLRGQDKDTFAHELAHHGFAQLTPKARAGWVTFYRGNKDLMPTKYALTNPNEGYAECYMKWARGFRLHKRVKAALESTFREMGWTPNR